MLRAAAAAYWLQPNSAAAEVTWTSPWARRSAVRVMASQRPAYTTLHLSDEYGDADVDISVGRTGITAEVEGTTVALGSVSSGGSTMTLSNTGQDTAYVVQREGDQICITRNGMAISARIGLKIDLPRAPGSTDRGGNIIDAPLHGGANLRRRRRRGREGQRRGADGSDEADPYPEGAGLRAHRRYSLQRR